MAVPDEALLQVLGIAHEHSRAGSGLALKDLIAQSGYFELRPSIVPADVEQVFAMRPDLAMDWVQFSEDKRTSGGWALTKEDSGWTIRGSASKVPSGEAHVFPSLASACAEYVLRELDFWAALSNARPDGSA